MDEEGEGKRRLIDLHGFATGKNSDEFPNQLKSLWINQSQHNLLLSCSAGEPRPRRAWHSQLVASRGPPASRCAPRSSPSVSPFPRLGGRATVLRTP